VTGSGATRPGSSETVHHGWLGDGAILAALHLPAVESSTGVVLCAPLAQEHVIAYRTQRLLASTLASQGVAVVRFDHAGFGDSTVEATRDSLSLGPRLAAEALRRSGCTKIIYAGFGSGALVAATAARDDAEAVGVALVDPPASGRNWLRRARTLYTVSLGPEVEPDPAGMITIAGADLDGEVAAAIKALTLDQAPDRGMPVLAVIRRGTTLPANLANAHTTVVETDDLPGLFDASSITSRIPAESVAAAGAWLLEQAGAPSSTTRPAHPELVSSVTLTEGCALLEERVVHVGPHRLFGIETRPVLGGDDAPVVILHNGASEHRIGASRYQVVLARRLAEQGIRSIRLDRRGTGETGAVVADEPDLLYAAEWLEDGEEAVAYANVPTERLGIIGLCVGAWMALVPTRVAPRFAVALSLGNYRTGPARHDQEADGARTVQAAGWTPRLRDRAMTLAKKRLPYGVLLAGARRGHLQFAEPVLAAPLAQGTDVVVVIGPSDTEIFEERRGHVALGRLRGLPGSLRVVQLESGDHSLFSPGMRSRSIDEAVETAVGAFFPAGALPPVEQHADTRASSTTSRDRPRARV